MTFFDAISVRSTRERTAEGFLKAKATLSTVGVQQYMGRELAGRVPIADDELDKIFNVFRPPTTVFHPETLKSAEMKPITMAHPDAAVTPDNYRMLSVGHLGDSVSPLDSDVLGGSVFITDEAAIKALESGKYEASLGYDAAIIRKSGLYKGLTYDFAFDGPMVINHLAIVEKGRCGSTVKILDKEIDMTKEEILALISDAQKVQQLSADDVKKLVVDSVASAVAGLASDKGFLKAIKDQLTPEEEEEEKKKKEEEMSDEEMTEEEKKKAEEMKAAAIKDGVAKRIELLEICRPFIKAEDQKDLVGMTDHAILVKAVGDLVKDADKMSADYLKGVLSSAGENRKAAGTQFGDASFNRSGAASLGRPLSGIDIQNLKGGE